MIEKKPILQPRFYKNHLIPAAVAALGLAAILCYFFADERVFSWLTQQPHGWYKNRGLAAFEHFGKVWALIWLLALGGLIVRQPKPVLVGLLALLIMTAIVLPTKSIIKRPRPRDVVKEQSATETKKHITHSWSFPSGDAAAAFAAAAAVIPFVSLGWSPLMLIAAAGIAILRVIVMAHYPSDVCAGAAAGIFAGWLALYIARRWILPESFNPYWFDAVAVIAVVVMPVCIGIFGGLWRLIDFLSIAAILVVGVFLITKVCVRLRQKQVSQ